MSTTLKQLEDLGFKPSKKKSPFAKKFDTLVYPLNKTDFLYIGFNHLNKETDFKRIWKSFIDVDGNRMAYQIVHLGDSSFRELKDYIDRHNRSKK